MIYIPHSVGVILAISNKGASTSIRNEYYVAGLKPLNLQAVRELRKSFWKVLGIVRDPIDRFESAYNFFKYKQIIRRCFRRNNICCGAICRKVIIII